MGIPGYPPDIARAYIPAHALDLSAKIRMREIELVTLVNGAALRKLPDLTKSPSERYKLSVCIKGSCTTCIQAALYNFYGLSLPQLCARSFLRNGRRRRWRKSRFLRFPYITLAMYFRKFVSVIGYIVTRTRWSDTQKGLNPQG